jgi:L-rhamnose isomerase
MTDEELLEKVKSGLSVDGSYKDTDLLNKIRGGKLYVLNAGVSEANLYTDLGAQLLTIWVNDTWDLSSGQIDFSNAFKIILQQLQAVSLNA